MEQSSKIPLVITKNSFSLTLKGKTAEALLQQPRPILWNNDGLYCWISAVRVVNLVSVIKDKQKHAEANDLLYNPEFRLVWNDGMLSKNGSAKEMAQAIEEMNSRHKRTRGALIGAKRQQQQ